MAEEKKEKEKLTLKGIVKKVLKVGTYIGAGAVAGCALKGVDLSSLKGIGKMCAGLGIVGLSAAAADAASNAIEKGVDEVTELVDEVSSEADESEEEDVVEAAAT
jgi:hypothetical protein